MKITYQKKAKLFDSPEGRKAWVLKRVRQNETRNITTPID